MSTDDGKRLLAILFDKALTGDLAINIRAGSHDGGAMLSNLYHAITTPFKDIPQWNEDRSIYFGMALRDTTHERPGTKDGCRVITALWGDLDAKDFLTVADPKAVTVEERAAGKKLILAALKTQLPANLQPSIVIDTGGGYQPLWLLKVLLRLGIDASVEDVEDTLRGLCQRIGVKASRPNVDSIMRLPGTVNVKYPDRPMATLLGVKAERRYTLEDFAMYRDAARASEAPRMKATSVPPSPDTGRDFPALLAWMRDKGWVLKKRGELHYVTCPWKGDHTGNSGQTETALYLPSEDNGWAGGFKCQHAHCAERRIGELYLMMRAEQAAERPGPAATTSPSTLEVLDMSTVTGRPINWLWPRRIPRGELTLIVGDPGAGKTFITEDAGVRICTGGPWPTGEPIGDPEHTIYLTVEDNPETSIKPRLLAMGSDGSRFLAVTGIRGAEGQPGRLLNLTTDLEAIERLCQERRARFLVVSPVNAYLGGGTAGRVDNYRDPDVRAVLSPLVLLAQRLDLAAVGVMHLNKTQQTQLLYRIGGSVGFAAVPRAIYAVVRDKHDRDRRHFTCIKMSDAPEPKTLPFRLVAPPGHTAARVEWEPESEETAADLMGEEPGKPGRPRKVEEAAEWLADFLRDGPRGHKDVLAAGSEMGYSLATLKRAKRPAGVMSDDTRDERGHITGHTWALAGATAA